MNGSSLRLPLALAPCVIALDATVLNSSMPAIAAELHTTLGMASLVFILYLMMFTGLTLPLGRLMDRSDAFSLLRLGFAIFGVGSVACAAASDVFWLCLGRCVQGVGGGILYAVTPVLVQRALPEDRQDQGYATVAMAFQVGNCLGPPLGGVLTSTLGWHAVFWLNLPLIAAGFWFIRGVQAPAPQACRNQPRARTLDVMLSFLGPAMLIFALNQGGELGWSSRPIVGALALSALLFAAFLFRQRRTEVALVDLGLARLRGFRLGSLTILGALFAGAGITFLLPFLFTHAQEMPLLHASFLLAVEPTLSMLTAPLTPWAVRHLGRPACMTLGLACRATAMLLLAVGLHQDVGAVTVPALVLAGCGFGLFYGPALATVMSSLPPDKVGTGSSVLSMTRLAAQVFGVLAFETLFSQLHSALPTPDAAHVDESAFAVALVLAAGLFVISALLAACTAVAPPLQELAP